MSRILDSAPDVPALIRELLATDAGRPRVTWYGPRDERVEFSAKTLNNWVAKTSNLLLDELDVTPGSRLGLALPAHWRSVVWLLAGWTVGAHVIIPPDPADADAVIPATGTTPAGAPGPSTLAITVADLPLDVLITDRPSTPPPGSRQSQLVVVALPALATRFTGDVPTGAVDAAAEVRLQPDVFLDAAHPGGSDPAFTAGGRSITYGSLLATARAAAGALTSSRDGVRLLTGGGPAQAIEAYLAPLACGGSVVIHHDLAGLTDAERRHLIDQEGITVE